MTQTARFIHNNKNPRLRYTAAYSFEKNADGTLKINYGIAQCSRVDSFSREQGRKLAEARLNKAFKGKVAPLKDERNDAALVPMYGTVTVTDEPGLSVGKLVTQVFESTRQTAMTYNSENAIEISDQELLRTFGIQL